MKREVRVLLKAAPWCCFSLELEGDNAAEIAEKIQQLLEPQPERSAGIRAVTELVLRNNAAARARTSRWTNGLIRLFTWRL
jgi:hypothetical protein